MITTMRHRGAGIVAAAWVALALLAGPSVVLATQPFDEPPGQAAPTQATPSEGAPTGEPHSTPAPTDGEIVYDGPFLTPTPDAVSVREVRATTGAPVMTPPSTDTPGGTGASTPGADVALLLLAVGGLSPLILLAGRVPAARRS